MYIFIQKRKLKPLNIGNNDIFCRIRDTKCLLRFRLKYAAGEKRSYENIIVWQLNEWFKATKILRCQKRILRNSSTIYIYYIIFNYIEFWHYFWNEGFHLSKASRLKIFRTNYESDITRILTYNIFSLC